MLRYFLQYIAHRLLLNNEGKKWGESLSTAQDDEIFEIARFINCVQFNNVVVTDFLKVVKGLPNIGASVSPSTSSVRIGDPHCVL